MFVEMVNDTIKKGVPIAKVVGDDDHTGINRVHQEGKTNIEKESDRNHVHKNVTKNCTACKKVTKVSHKRLSFLSQRTSIICCNKTVVSKKMLPQA